jgi:putative DNA primase/helicase
MLSAQDAHVQPSTPGDDAATSPLPHPGRTKAEIEAAPEKPARVKINADRIPASLKALRQWVLWRWEKDDNGRWTKIPYGVNGRMASSTNPSTWARLEECREVWRRDLDKYVGVGFMFAEGGGLTGTDLDNAIDENGRLKPWAGAKVRRLDTYCEVSPSGTGVKLWALANKPGSEWSKRPFADGEIEMYDRTRFFTVTGALWPGCPATVESRQDAVTEIYQEVLAAKVANEAAKKKPCAGAPGFGTAKTNGATLTDDEIIEKAGRANGDKFRRLMAGSTADYDADDSRADAGLCSILAFWTRDGVQIDRLFRRSGLMRAKWDERRGETTYGDTTIKNALEFVTEHYGSRNGHAYHAGNGAVPPAGDGGEHGGDNEPQGDRGADDIHLTDLGNARRVVKRHGADLRYCKAFKDFFAWDGGRWAQDEAGAAAPGMVKETQGNLYRCTVQQLAALRQEGAEGDDGERAAKAAKLTQLLKHCLKWEDDRRITACLNQIKSEPGVPIVPADLDRDVWLFNAVNGTIDLRSGELRPHRREDLLSQMAAVEYDPDAKCPLWEKVLDRIMDGRRHLTDYLQRVVGYSLTADVREQCLFFLYGKGANGKSTFLNAVRGMMGDYACQAVSELLMAKNTEAHPTERADLFGRRFVATIETDQGKRMAEALMKQLTGGDAVRARKMRQDFFEMTPTWKIFLAANYKPTIRGQDFAAWRRIKLIPFVVTIPDAEKDKELPDKLRAEWRGILRWAVEGCLLWQKEGLGEPEEVRKATDDYKADQDLVQGFINECCFCHPTAKAAAAVLLERYAAWSGDRTMTANAFGTALREKGFEPTRLHGGARAYQGIGLHPERERASFEDEEEMCSPLG